MVSPRSASALQLFFWRLSQCTGDWPGSEQVGSDGR